MKIDITGVSERKLIAVVGSNGKGIYFHRGAASTYITPDGRTLTDSRPLDDLLREDKSRRALYEGDTITITF